MEAQKVLSRRKKTPLKQDGLKTNEALNFRRVARQVMLSNVFTRRKTFSESSTDRPSVTKTPRKEGEETDKTSIKRQGTSELFPMSEEMTQTVVALGLLDLLPDERRGLHAASQRKNERSAGNGSKFRERTKEKVVYPQRFIRRVCSSLVDSKNAVATGAHCLDGEHGRKNGSDNELHDKGYFSATENNERGSLTAKSKHNLSSKPGSLHFPRVSKPTYVKRSSDLGPPLLRAQMSFPTNGSASSRFSSSRSKLVPTRGSRRAMQIHCWQDGGSPLHESDKIKETQGRRRWKSVESLTREIENKCYTWLENRH